MSGRPAPADPDAEAFAELRLELGAVPASLRVLARAPRAWSAVWTAWRGVLFEGELPRTTKELLALASASEAGRDDLSALWRDALARRGLQPKLLEDVALGRATTLPKRTRLVLGSGARLVKDPAALGDEDFAALRHVGLGDAELAELVAACGVLRLLLTVDVALDPPAP